MFWSAQWFEECQRLHNQVLKGKYCHWCPEWNNGPIDETVWHCCACFLCRCGELTVPKEYPLGIKPILRMHENLFVCPRSRWWNFWWHDVKDFS